MKKYRDLTTEDIVAIDKVVREADPKMVLDLVQEGFRKIARLMELEKINPKNIKKFEAFFKEKPFVYKHSENHWWGFILHCDDDDMYKVRREQIKRVYTPRGYLYFTREKGLEKGEFLVYTAHFFERYMQRLGYKNKDVSIRNFMKHILLHPGIPMAEKPIEGSRRRHDVFMRMENGVGLGTSVGPTAVIMTFVTDELLRRKQLQTVEQMECYLEGRQHRQLR